MVAVWVHYPRVQIHKNRQYAIKQRATRPLFLFPHHDEMKRLIFRDENRRIYQISVQKQDDWCPVY